MVSVIQYRHGSVLAWAVGIALCVACNTLPSDLKDYRERCERMNAEPIGPTPDDPHDGFKEVYGCNVEAAELAAPYPDGTLIVKESCPNGPCRDGDMVWLIASARKDNGRWRWNEYTRNFEDEEFVEILASENVCINCHKRVEEKDWIYTVYRAP